jgi:hypothetical protein
MDAILQEHLPYYPWMDPRLHRLPGILPVEAPEDWLRVDEAYGGQMARRDALIAEKRAAVHALLPEGEAAAGELYAQGLAILAGRPGYEIGKTEARRPDGMRKPGQRRTVGWRCNGRSGRFMVPITLLVERSACGTKAPARRDGPALARRLRRCSGREGGARPPSFCSAPSQAIGAPGLTRGLAVKGAHSLIEAPARGPGRRDSWGPGGGACEARTLHLERASRASAGPGDGAAGSV